MEILICVREDAKSSYILRERGKLHSTMAINLSFFIAARKFTSREQGERGGCEISRFRSGD